MPFLLFCPVCGAILIKSDHCEKCGWKEDEN